MKRISVFLVVLMLIIGTMGSVFSFAVPTDEGSNNDGTKDKTVKEVTKDTTKDTPTTDNTTNNTVDNQQNTYTPNEYPIYTTPDTTKLQDTISIIFTHDMHSHLDSTSKTKDGKTVQVGGFPKMKTMFDEVSEENDSTFILDAGDFSMGTPFQTIFTTDAAELNMMGYLGYDATTFGNHEFDYKASGLNKMLKAAMGGDEKENLPNILCANIDWDKTLKDSDQKKDAKKLKDTLDKYGMKDYKVIKKGDYKIAVFGVNGKDSDKVAPESGLFFSDAAEASTKVIKEIKDNEENIDLVVCLSHSGTSQEEGTDSEDEDLAKAVDGIDLIISGHTHTVLKEPIKVNDTLIASCGEYTDNIGVIKMKKDKKSKKFELDSYKIKPVNEKVDADYSTEMLVDQYKATVNSKYFSKFGYTMDQVLVNNSIKFPSTEDFGMKQGEEPLGDLIADSYKYGVKKATGDNVDVAVVNKGVIRSTFSKGNLTVEDAFNISSLGTGPDGIAGYPLVKFYLTASEIRNAAEIDVSISPDWIDTRLYMSGMSYTYNPHRLYLNRVYETKLDLGHNKYKEFDSDKLYCVVADLYACQMLSAVEDESYGLLSVTPKDKNGNEIKDFEKHIVYNGKRELKTWQSVAKYLDHFSSGKLPKYYSKTHDRKVEDDSYNIITLLKNPNKVGWLLYGGIVLVILIIIVIVLVIRAVIIKRNGGPQPKEKKMFSERQKKKILKRPKKQKNLFSSKKRRRW